MSKFLPSLPKTIAVFLISAYQATISPDHGWFKARHPHGFCKFYPTCSEYGKQAIQNFGLIKGGFLAAARIVRCHPWAKPAVDKVPTFLLKS